MLLHRTSLVCALVSSFPCVFVVRAPSLPKRSLDRSRRSELPRMSLSLALHGALLRTRYRIDRVLYISIYYVVLFQTYHMYRTLFAVKWLHIIKDITTRTATGSCRTRKRPYHYSPGVFRRSHAAALHVRPAAASLMIDGFLR